MRLLPVVYSFPFALPVSWQSLLLSRSTSRLSLPMKKQLHEVQKLYKLHYYESVQGNWQHGIGSHPFARFGKCHKMSQLAEICHNLSQLQKSCHNLSQGMSQLCHSFFVD